MIAIAINMLVFFQALVTAATTTSYSYGLRFEMFKGEDTYGDKPVFRLAIDTMVAGQKFSLLLDTGSATLALCNGTTDHVGRRISPAKPVPSTDSSAWKTVISYGGCPSHGFIGTVKFAQVGIGAVQADAIIVIMGARDGDVVGERGNACGFPVSGSLGATRLEGIFGFAGQRGNGPYFAYSTCKNTSIDFKKCLFPSGCQPQNQRFASSFSDILLPSANVQNTFSIVWSGKFGVNSGTLRLGKSEVRGRHVTTAMLYWAQTSYYGLNITRFDASVSPSGRTQPLIGAAARVRSDVNQVMVDTGSPSISIPQATCDAIDAHFYQSEDLVTISISVHAATSSPSTLELPIRKNIWKDSNVFDCEEATGEDWKNMVGLSLWIWYDVIEFDIDNGVFQFFAQPDPFEIQDRVVELLQSKKDIVFL